MKKQMKTKADQIRSFLKKGKTALEIIKSMRKKGVTVYYSEVYSAGKGLAV